MGGDADELIEISREWSELPTDRPIYKQGDLSVIDMSLSYVWNDEKIEVKNTNIIQPMKK